MAFTPDQNALLRKITWKFTSNWEEAKTIGNYSQWNRGDILIKYMRLAKRLGLDEEKTVLASFSESVKERYGSMNCYAWVSEKFPSGCRGIDLSWSHYRAVADSEKPVFWLEIAIKENLGTRQLTSRITKEEAKVKHYRGKDVKCTMCPKMVSKSQLKLYKGDELQGSFCSHICLAAYASNVAIKKQDSGEL